MLTKSRVTEECFERRRTPFWRGGTSDASKFHGSDGAASAPRLSIHLSRCGLAFTPFVSGCNTHRIVARHGLGRHWRPRGKRPGRASGGRPFVTRHGRHRTSPALHVTRKTRSRRLAVAPLHHGASRCTMEHHDATGVSPRDKRGKLVRTGINGCSAVAHRHHCPMKFLPAGGPTPPKQRTVAPPPRVPARYPSWAAAT